MSKIKFLTLQVTEVNLKADTYDQLSTDEIKSGPLKINCHAGAPEDKAFGISFEISLKNKEDDFNMQVKAIAHFESDEILTKEFMQSDFVYINAPAIAFPFLRAFISTITLNSGYSPIVLPSFNFVAMAKQLKDRSIAFDESVEIKDKKKIKKLKHKDN